MLKFAISRTFSVTFYNKYLIKIDIRTYQYFYQFFG